MLGALLYLDLARPASAQAPYPGSPKQGHPRPGVLLLVKDRRAGSLGALTGLTRSTDRLIVKMILGRRFGAGREPTGPERL